jgi:hypothetical protein
VKTFTMVVAIGLVGSLLAAGAYWRSERVRSAYRIKGLQDRLAHAKNENEWLKGGLERKKNPLAIERAAKRVGLKGFVKDIPVIAVVPLDHSEDLGS